MTHLKQRTDEELVTMYASGMNSAFDVLLERYKDKLYSYILYLVHNADVADDLFQSRDRSGTQNNDCVSPK